MKTRVRKVMMLAAFLLTSSVMTAGAAWAPTKILNLSGIGVGPYVPVGSGGSNSTGTGK